MERTGKYDPRTHGVSYSMLSDFMSGRQKARYRIQGIKSKAPAFALTFGSVAHEVLDVAYNEIARGVITTVPDRDHIMGWIAMAEKTWNKANPGASTKALQFLELSLLYAEAVFPHYFEFYADTIFKMEWDESLTEKFHRFPFKIAGYETIPILVKMDSAYWKTAILKKTKKKVSRLWLFETKTSSRIDEANIVDLLPSSLQQNIYMLALHDVVGTKPKGATRNVIRRPGQRRGQKETLKDFGVRIEADIKKRPEHYFKRFSLLSDDYELELCRSDLQGVLVDFLKWFDGKSIHYRNTNECDGKYGRCQYTEGCLMGNWGAFNKEPEDG